MAGYTAPTTGGYYYDPSAALAIQAANEAATQAYNNARLNNLEIPQLGFTATSDAIKNLLSAGQLGLTQSDDALKYLLSGGQLGLSQQSAAQQELQAAATQQSNEALDAMKLAASLSGPKDAFQQQAVLEGLNNAGLSRGVGAIAGQYALPTFQAPQAAPQAASLGTLAQQFAQAPGSYAGMTPSEIAMQSALANRYAAPSYAAPTMGAANRLLTGPSYAAPGMSGAQQMFNAAGQFDNGVAVKGAPSGMSGPAGSQTFGPFAGYTPMHLQAMQGSSGRTVPGTGLTPSTQTSQLPASAYGQIAGYAAPGGSAGQPNYSAAAYGAALPNLNQINSRNWLQLPKSTQDFLTSAYGANGYSAQDVADAVKANLPQFHSPAFGLVGA
ncbi:MAG: hypothetical protein KGL39_05825 [Patescibacteria group bacterium]|nr:hypothetical protein [Patescibacteria group bacterium]